MLFLQGERSVLVDDRVVDPLRRTVPGPLEAHEVPGTHDHLQLEGPEACVALATDFVARIAYPISRLIDVDAGLVPVVVLLPVIRRPTGIGCISHIRASGLLELEVHLDPPTTDSEDPAAGRVALAVDRGEVVDRLAGQR